MDKLDAAIATLATLVGLGVILLVVAIVCLGLHTIFCGKEVRMWRKEDKARQAWRKMQS
jgi:hypothetical protein